MMTDEEIDELLAQIRAQQAEDQLKEEQKKKEEELRKAREAEAASKKRGGRTHRNLILNLLLVFFAAVFIISGVYLFKYYYDSKQNKKLVSSLKEMIEDDGSGSDDPSSPNYKPSNAKVPEFVTVGDRRIQRKFRALYEKNNDFVGWLTVEGTNIDFPVMYTPDQEQKYLRKNFDGDYALAGTLFIAAASDPFKPTTNVIIYGHNMKDGSMFSDLLSYKDESFYQEHKRIRFDTLEGNGTYEVIAAFPGQVLNVGEEGFRYYDFYDAASAEEFDTYISEIKSRCTYQIPTTAEFGDHLITLSTCENSGASEGKRFVVVAKRID